MDPQTRAVIQNLSSTAGSKCYQACIKYPDQSLSDSEKNCILRCTDRFLEAIQVTMVALESYVVSILLFSLLRVITGTKIQVDWSNKENREKINGKLFQRFPV